MIKGLHLELSDEQEEILRNFIKENYASRYVYEKTLKERDELFQKADELEELNRNHSKNTSKIDQLMKEKETLQKELEQSKIDHEASLQKVKIDYAVRDRLKIEGAKNIRVVLPLLEYDKLNLDEKGELLGLEDQIKSLKSSDDTKFLFHEESHKGNDISGYKEMNAPNLSSEQPVTDPFSLRLTAYARSLIPPQ